MLTELRIENFAIIDKLELDLKPGLIIFTGETGAGKSIIMDALEMLLGGRTDATVLRRVFSSFPASRVSRSTRFLSARICLTMKAMSPWRAKCGARDDPSPGSTAARSISPC
jgi:recombinational DNA repair ATPase RecF